VRSKRQNASKYSFNITWRRLFGCREEAKKKRCRIGLRAYAIAIINGALRRGLVEEEEYYSLAQVCPGGVPITIAIIVGKRLAGVPGFFVALIAETLPGFVVLLILAILSLDPHMTVLRAALRGASAAALGAMVANAIQMSWPFRAKPVDVVLVVLVAAAVIVFHFTV
jgi:chromate transport protein ChrA